MEAEQQHSFQSLSAGYLRQNKMYWLMVLIGMLGLILITYFLDAYNLYHPFLPENATVYDKPFMVLIILLLFIAFYMRRRFLVTSVIVKKATSKMRQKYGREFSSDVKLYQGSLTELRNIYMRVWTLANIITVVAFLFYSLSGQINNFYIYALAGIYTIITTFPSDIHVKYIYDKIFNNTVD